MALLPNIFCSSGHRQARHRRQRRVGREDVIRFGVDGKLHRGARAVPQQLGFGDAVAAIESSSRRPFVAFVGQGPAPRTRSAVEHRPAEVIAQALVIEDEFANRRWELVALLW